MKLIYISNIDFKNKKLIGIKNKCISQKKSFEGCDIDIHLMYSRGFSQFITNNDNEYLINQFYNKFSNKFFRFNNLADYIEKNNIKYVYIRHVCNTDIFMINFLKKIRNKVEKIYLEVPTYPYDNEINKLSYAYINDIILRKYLINYINKIVTFSEDNYIFGIPTIKISNGIDIKSIKLKSKKSINNDKVINLIAIANISFWHGYDRVIEGLNQYYNSDDFQNKYYIVKFHIVGEGDEFFNLKEMVKKYKLEEFVIFYGWKFGLDIDIIFDNMDIAIASLGSHRKGIRMSSALKVKEYCARGIPFIHSCYENGFSQNEEFLMKIPEDDSYLNIDSVIEFYKKLKPFYNDIIVEMRRYAEEKFSWDIQVKKIVDDFGR